jgi:hypothetical protein
MAQAQVLIGSVNPYGSLEAFVEDDGRTVYLWLRHPQDYARRPCALWVANRLPAPAAPDIASMKKGVSPMMHQAGTRYPQGHGAFNPAELRLVWFEEGDGVALLQQGGVLAVIPPWADPGTCPGYAHEAVGQTQLAWELAPALEGLGPRIAHADRYWAWRADPNSWATLRDGLLAHLEARLGPHQRYWAADGGQYPPRAVASFSPPTAPGISVLATLGMSAQSMPQIEMAFEDPSPYRRIELCVGARTEDPALGGLLSAMMIMPWQEITWLGEGHTYSWDKGPGGRDYPGRSAGLLLKNPASSTSGNSTLIAPQLDGHLDASREPVSFLWVVPITKQEQGKAQKSGSDSLYRELAAPGRGWVWNDSPSK